MFLSVRSKQAELLDEESIPADQLMENFRDIRRINRYFGGAKVILKLLDRLVFDNRPRSLRILDIATGAADIPLAISQWAARRAINVEITATDYSRDILNVARATIAGAKNIELAQADARALPYPDNSYDIAICSLALHHFDDDEALQILRQMRRVAPVMIINDLRRSLTGYLAAHLYGHLLTRNRLTRNDAPLSVLRAFTSSELTALATRAGLTDAVVEQQPGWRLSLISKR